MRFILFSILSNSSFLLPLLLFFYLLFSLSSYLMNYMNMVMSPQVKNSGGKFPLGSPARKPSGSQHGKSDNSSTVRIMASSVCRKPKCNTPLPAFLQEAHCPFPDWNADHFWEEQSKLLTFSSTWTFIQKSSSYSRLHTMEVHRKTSYGSLSLHQDVCEM